MSETDEILSGVQAAIADVLVISPEEAQPSLSYLVDLAGGESLELLDLQFRLDKRFGVRLAGIGNFAAPRPMPRAASHWLEWNRCESPFPRRCLIDFAIGRHRPPGTCWTR